MRYGPTKIDFDVNDLVLAHCDDLGIAKTSTVCVTTFISHEYPVAIGNEIDKIETAERLAVRPATRKVGRTVNPGINRAGEMEVMRDQFLNCRAIFAYISVVSSARDCDVIVCFACFLRHRLFGRG